MPQVSNYLTNEVNQSGLVFNEHTQASCTKQWLSCTSITVSTMMQVFFNCTNQSTQTINCSVNKHVVYSGMCNLCCCILTDLLVQCMAVQHNQTLASSFTM